MHVREGLPHPKNIGMYGRSKRDMDADSLHIVHTQLATKNLPWERNLELKDKQTKTVHHKEDQKVKTCKEEKTFIEIRIDELVLEEKERWQSSDSLWKRLHIVCRSWSWFCQRRQRWLEENFLLWCSEWSLQSLLACLNSLLQYWFDLQPHFALENLLVLPQRSLHEPLHVQMKKMRSEGESNHRRLQH